MDYVVIVESYRLATDESVKRGISYVPQRTSKVVLPAFDKDDAYAMARKLERYPGTDLRRDTYVAIRFNTKDGTKVISLEIFKDMMDQYTAPNINEDIAVLDELFENSREVSTDTAAFPKPKTAAPPYSKPGNGQPTGFKA